MQDGVGRVWGGVRARAGDDVDRAIAEVKDFVGRPGVVAGLVHEGIDCLEERMASEASIGGLARKEAARRSVRSVN